ncbi:MAG: hypothetical protein P1U53_02810 [Sulfitobacter sp.]|nr:hypothetical protein [Sulfitobacter sp.]
MIRLLHCLSLLLTLAACAGGVPDRGGPEEVQALARSIAALSPAINPAEAQRAAALSYAQTHRLALAYQITDPPLIHNAKVNAGIKPRGLCYHWAEDMEAALVAEGFRTLDIQRAIANSESLILIEHSTAVITPRGAPMQSGIVIDPWREGGRLFWKRVADDRRYDWLPRDEALRRKGQIRYAQRPEGSLAPPPRIN